MQNIAPSFTNVFVDDEGKLVEDGGYTSAYCAAEELYHAADLGSYLYTLKLTDAGPERLDLEEDARAFGREAVAAQAERNGLQRWYEGAR